MAFPVTKALCDNLAGQAILVAVEEIGDSRKSISVQFTIGPPWGITSGADVKEEAKKILQQVLSEL
jgi:hypothetical protein